MEIGVPVITMCSTGGHPAIQQFPRPSTIAMAGNKSFHGCFQVFIKNSWGISIITAWMSAGNFEDGVAKTRVRVTQRVRVRVEGEGKGKGKDEGKGKGDC